MLLQNSNLFHEEHFCLLPFIGIKFLWMSLIQNLLKPRCTVTSRCILYSFRFKQKGKVKCLVITGMFLTCCQFKSLTALVYFCFTFRVSWVLTFRRSVTSVNVRLHQFRIGNLVFSSGLRTTLCRHVKLKNSYCIGKTCIFCTVYLLYSWVVYGR